MVSVPPSFKAQVNSIICFTFLFHAETIPVIAYIAVISTMLWTAIMTRNRYAMVGSLLFVISDSILSWNMFVAEIRYSNVWIMTTYYAAQFLIATSISAFDSPREQALGSSSLNTSAAP